MLFWSENRPEWVVALWGSILEGVIAVPLDFRSSAALVERIAAIVNARALLIGDAVGSPAVIPALCGLCGEICIRGEQGGAFAPAAPGRCRGDSFHLRRHRRAQGRHDHASQYPCESEAHRRRH